MIKKSNFLLILLLALLIGFGAGTYLVKRQNHQSYGACDPTKYNNINPELVCSPPAKINKRNYVEFKTELNQVIQEKITNQEISSASIYFRDLQNGPTFGIDEYASFSPASLLKLPLFLTYLNLTETKPELLDTEIGFSEIEFISPQYYSPKQSVDPSKPYTIRELLRYMIEYSDNRAYYVLREYLNQLSPNHDVLKDTYVDLGIIDPKSNLDETINVKSYGAIFSQLYHSSYLSNQELSEYALSVLSQTDFQNGIVQGVPEEIQVAHKFGERSDESEAEKQLHDCGIVYYPENPYLVCIMTRGQDFNDLSQTMGLISKMIYEEFDSRRL